MKKIASSFFRIGVVLGTFFCSVPFLTHAATLSLSPSSGSYTVNDTVTVSILIDTMGIAIDGVDIHYLRYDPSYLELSDADGTRPGVQIAAGSLMANTVQNRVNTAAGTIDFSQLTAGGTKFTSKGAEVLATINFRVKGSGSGSLTFDATPGASNDTNVVAFVKELLVSATGALYTLSSPSGNISGGSSSSSGGGGGGGSYVLAPPSGVSALGGPDQVLLRWTNPTSSNFVRARIIRKVNSQPTSPNDGTIVYEGDQQTYTDTDVMLGTTYYYAVFSLDTALQASSLSIVKATVGEFTEQQVIIKVTQDDNAKKLQPTATVFTPVIYYFSVALQEGFTHEEVRLLQKLLNALGFTISSSGVGSPDNETTYFGTLTKNAVARFQAKYVPSIGAGDRGLVGPLTRVKLNELAATVSVSTGYMQPKSFVFTRDLVVGSRGEDVRQLQEFLNTNGFVIASAGDGSPGSETTFFGNLTKTALIRFQETYKDEILTPAGLVKGSGYFGANTRKKIHGLLRLTLPAQASPQAQSQMSQLQDQIRNAQEQVNRLLQQLQTTQGQ